VLIVLAGLMLAVSVVPGSFGTNGRYEARQLVAVPRGSLASRAAVAKPEQAKAGRAPRRFERGASHPARRRLLASDLRASLGHVPCEAPLDGRHLYMQNCTLRC
jgi:hypothetical protein